MPLPFSQACHHPPRLISLVFPARPLIEIGQNETIDGINAIFSQGFDAMYPRAIRMIRKLHLFEFLECFREGVKTATPEFVFMHPMLSYRICVVTQLKDKA